MVSPFCTACHADEVSEWVQLEDAGSEARSDNVLPQINKRSMLSLLTYSAVSGLGGSAVWGAISVPVNQAAIMIGLPSVH